MLDGSTVQIHSSPFLDLPQRCHLTCRITYNPFQQPVLSPPYTPSKKEERTDRVRDAMLRHGTTFSRQARMAFTFKRRNFLSGLISSAFPTDTCRIQRLIPNLSGGDGPRQTLSEKMSFGLVSTSICWISSLPLIEVCILSQQKYFSHLITWS